MPDPKPKKTGKKTGNEAGPAPAKSRLEELLEQAAKPGPPESPRDFVQRRMHELGGQSDKES